MKLMSTLVTNSEAILLRKFLGGQGKSALEAVGGAQGQPQGPETRAVTQGRTWEGPGLV